MTTSNFDKVVEQVKTLNRAEWWRLRDLLDVWLEPPSAPMTEDQFEQELLREGTLESIPPPITDFTPYENRTPIEVKGKPLSETIIEERR